MTKKKPKLSLEELQKQRDDVEALLASIEEAYSDGSMPEAQYQEIKAANETKLQEINEKMDKAAAEGPGPGEAPPSPPAEAPPTSGAPPAEAPPAEPAPPAPPVPAESPASPMPPSPEAAPPGPQPASGAGAAEPGPSGPAKIEMPDEILEMIKGIKDGKIGGNAELSKKVEKIEVDIEKVKSFVDALKDERTSYDERIQRVSEEMGELRSNLNTMDGRMGEVEIKSDESHDIVKNLKPQYLTGMLQERDNDIKAMKARVEKIEDVLSNTLKKVGEIRGFLQSLGSIDNLANMSKDIARKVIMIDDKVKKTDRMAERIDTVFGELNKRLEEFMFYKAKQQSIDEMTHDLMRNIEEISTRLDGFVQKSDLDSMKDSIMAKVGTAAPAGEVAPTLTGPQADVQKQIDELKELDKMLDEQKKMGALKEDEYNKSKQANQKRMTDLMNKMEQATTTAATASPASANPPSPEPTTVPETPQPEAAQPSPTEPAPAPQPVPEPAPPVPAAQEPAPATPEEPKPPETAAGTQPVPEPSTTQPTPEPVPAPPGPVAVPLSQEKELKKESTPFGEMYKLQDKAKTEEGDEPLSSSGGQPGSEKKESKPTVKESSPEKEPPEKKPVREEKPGNDEPPKNGSVPEEPPENLPVKSRIKKGMDKKQRMITELEDSFRSGLLSEKAYFRTKKLLGLLG